MSLQSVMTRLIFSLPSGVIQAMAGKKTEADGKTLDPRIALMAKEAAKQAAKAPPGFVLTPDVAREGMKTGFALCDAPRRANVATRDLTVPGGGGVPLEARLYTPPNATGNEPLLVYMHQGGCVLGGLWTCDTWCSILAEDARAVVLNVNYRHAPEDKFPASVDDAIAAFEWAVANAKSLGADGKRIGVGGDSAGGNLAAVAAQAHRDASPPLKGQLLIYPVTDFTAEHPSLERNGEGLFLTRDDMEWFRDNYIADEADGADPKASPRLGELAGLAPAVVVTAEMDPLLDDGEAYADALEEAGVPVLRRQFDSLIHGFLALGAVSPKASAAVDSVCADLRDLLG